MKRKKQNKKILFIFFIVIIIIGIYFFIKFNGNKTYIIETDNVANINELYIYGRRLNLNGIIKISNDFKEINLLLHNKEDISIPLNYIEEDNDIEFKITDKINDGFLLDKLDINEYNLYIEVIGKNEEKIYYKLNNLTKYDNTKYYSIRENGKYKSFVLTNKNDTINLNIKNSNDDVYDIVIDPGHGGIDKGACYNGHCEIDFTYKISSIVKEKLENKGYRVKLTRNELNSDERLPNYGDNGRVNVALDSKGKYLLAIHLNSNAYSDSGLEVYTANNVDYSFAKSLAQSIIDKTGTKYSTNNSFKVQDGVYMRTMLSSDVDEAYENAINGGYEPYDISTETTYYFIIRETGGYMSGAYKDNRDGTPGNNYYNSNVGIESYLVELGYLTSTTDTKNIKNNMEKYADGIADALIEKIENEK